MHRNVIRDHEMAIMSKKKAIKLIGTVSVSKTVVLFKTRLEKIVRKILSSGTFIYVTWF